MDNQPVVEKTRTPLRRFLSFLVKIPLVILIGVANADSEEDDSGSGMIDLYKKDPDLFK